jgi:hypothetical protein
MTAVILQFIFRGDTNIVHIGTNRTEMHICKERITRDSIIYIDTINFNLTPLKYYNIRNRYVSLMLSILRHIALVVGNNESQL